MRASGETISFLRMFSFSPRGREELRGLPVPPSFESLQRGKRRVFTALSASGAVRDNVNEAVPAVAADHIAEFYGGAREADGFARHPEDGAFNFNINTGDVQDKPAQAADATNAPDPFHRRRHKRHPV